MSRRFFRLRGGLACLAAATALVGCSDGIAADEGRGAATMPAAAPYVAVARGKVDVEGGLLELGSVEDGQVDSVAVQEGARVAQGDPLFHLAAEDAQLELELANAQLHRAEVALDTQATPLARADVDIARQRVALAQLRVTRRTVRAPQAGTVLALHVQPGTVAGARAGRPLAVLLPDRPPIVRAEVNESFVGRLKPGMRAEVTVPSDPRAAPIPGRLARIGQTFAASRLDDDAALRANVRVVECVIVFTGPLALRIGQNVQVTFHD